MENVLAFPQNEQAPLTEREWKLILFIREKGFGSLTVDFQHGEPKVIREAIGTIKL